MNTPTIYDVWFLGRNYNENQILSSTGEYIPARPMGLQGLNLKLRLKAAWKVFTGKADVVVWGDGQ